MKWMNFKDLLNRKIEMFYEIEEYISVKLSFQSYLWALGWRRFGSDAFNLLGALDQNSVFEMGLINYKEI